MPALFMFGGYASLMVVAALYQPQEAGGPAPWPVLVAGLVGFVATLGGLAALLRRTLRALRDWLPRPGDHDLARRWEAATAHAGYGHDHLVWVSRLHWYGRSGCSAWCQPYWSNRLPHSAWFSAVQAQQGLQEGRWMHVTGEIGSGSYGDSRVLYVYEVLDSLPARAPRVANRLASKHRPGLE